MKCGEARGWKRISVGQNEERLETESITHAYPDE